MPALTVKSSRGMFLFNPMLKYIILAVNGKLKGFSSSANHSVENSHLAFVWKMEVGNKRKVETIPTAFRLAINDRQKMLTIFLLNYEHLTYIDSVYEHPTEYTKIKKHIGFPSLWMILPCNFSWLSRPIRTLKI